MLLHEVSRVVPGGYYFTPGGCQVVALLFSVIARMLLQQVVAVISHVNARESPCGWKNVARQLLRCYIDVMIIKGVARLLPCYPSWLLGCSYSRSWQAAGRVLSCWMYVMGSQCRMVAMTSQAFARLQLGDCLERSRGSYGDKDALQSVSNPDCNSKSSQKHKWPVTIRNLGLF